MSAESILSFLSRGTGLSVTAVQAALREIIAADAEPIPEPKVEDIVLPKRSFTADEWKQIEEIENLERSRSQRNPQTRLR
jgi:hypothetical protein